MARESSIVQIVPRLGASTDGVADYARILGSAMQVRHELQSSFLGGDPSDALDPALYGRAAKVEARSAESLAAALRALQHAQESGVVLLHYVGYGYAPRGCPWWLVSGLQRWKQQQPSARLITMFHELYASGAPWRSSFWLSPVQRHLARRLVQLSDGAVTSLEFYRRRLARWDPRKSMCIALRPVYSAVGEPARLRPWAERPRWLAVFGRAGTETRAYGKRREVLAQAAHALKVEQIVDIGPRSARVPAELHGIPVRACGWLAGDEVSRLLAQCRFGFLDYRSDLLPKSTIFAAYCAHGVVPLVADDQGAGMDGLEPGTQYLLAAASERSVDSAEEIARAASTWYRGHDAAAQAQDFAQLLTKDMPR